MTFTSPNDASRFIETIHTICPCNANPTPVVPMPLSKQSTNTRYTQASGTPFHPINPSQVQLCLGDTLPRSERDIQAIHSAATFKLPRPPTSDRPSPSQTRHAFIPEFLSRPILRQMHREQTKNFNSSTQYPDLPFLASSQLMSSQLSVGQKAEFPQSISSTFSQSVGSQIYQPPGIESNDGTVSRGDLIETLASVISSHLKTKSEAKKSEEPFKARPSLTMTSSSIPRCSITSNIVADVPANNDQPIRSVYDMSSIELEAAITAILNEDSFVSLVSRAVGSVFREIY